jgi:hypothetical protein
VTLRTLRCDVDRPCRGIWLRIGGRGVLEWADRAAPVVLSSPLDPPLSDDEHEAIVASWSRLYAARLAAEDGDGSH